MNASTHPVRRALGLDAREWATIFIALAAATLPAVLPLMVGVLARQFGLEVEQAGYVIAINMGAILVGSLSCLFVARRFTWTTLIVVGLFVMTAGNVLTLITEGLTSLIVSRVVAGWGEGVVSACCYALMGRACLPGRSIALYVGGQAVVGAAGMAVLPTLMAAYGWHVFYLLVSLVALPALALVPLAVRGRVQIESKAPGQPNGARQLPSLNALGALLAIFLFFVGLAMVWAFMERLGTNQNLSLIELSVALSASSIASLAGSFVAGAVADRLRVAIGLGLGIALIGASLGILLTGGFYPYAIGICGLSFAWAFQFPLLFECLVDADRDGRVTVLTPAATGGALAAGPAIGGFVLAHGSLAMLCVGCLVLTLAGTLIAASVRRRSRITPV